MKRKMRAPITEADCVYVRDGCGVIDLGHGTWVAGGKPAGRIWGIYKIGGVQALPYSWLIKAATAQEALEEYLADHPRRNRPHSRRPKATEPSK